jgi:hypothetical protein
MAIKDRTYYRSMDLTEILEEVKLGINVNWHEMAIALSEMLEDEVKDKDEAASDAAYDGDWSYCPNCGYELQ